MRSRLPRWLGLLVALVVASLQLLLSAGAAHAEPDMAEYCVNKPATYVLGREVLPAGSYCVPGP